MNRFLATLLALATLALTGCDPEEIFWWSPAGDKAIVLVDQQLHRVAPDGELGPSLLPPDTKKSSSPELAWLPDGSGLIVARQRDVATWEETKALINPDEVERVEARIPTVLPLLEAIASLSDQPDSLEALIDHLTAGLRVETVAAFLVVYEREPARVEALLRKHPNGEEAVSEIKDMRFEVSEILKLPLGLPGETSPVSLARSLTDAFSSPQCSPTQAAVAFRRTVPGEIQWTEETESESNLEILSLDGTTSLSTGQAAAASYAWTPDGRSLIFASPNEIGGEEIRVIRRLTVIGESGTLMKPAPESASDDASQPVDSLSPPSVLATALAPTPFQLDVLPDGRVLFASRPLRFPQSGTEAESAMRLYLVSPDGATIEAVPDSPDGYPNHYRLSPDGTRLAGIDGNTDAVTVFDLASGRTTLVSPAHPHWKSGVLPAWKSATELTFAGLDGELNEPRWLLWSEESGIRCINSKWPAEISRDWLSEQKPDPSSPAANPE